MSDITTLMMGAAGQVSGDYQISRSLRFNSADSAYLSRTPASAGNRKTWTWSGWVKRSKINNGSGYTFLFTADLGSNSNTTSFFFNTDDSLRLEHYPGSYQILCVTNAIFRDVSAWYHVVLSVDTTQATNSNGIKLYVNGVQQTLSFTHYTQNTETFVNSTNAHGLGYGYASDQYPNIYLTEVNFIDGQALTPSSFGETDATTGVWKPIRYAGTYGTNGFHLDFSDNSSTTALGYDAAGSNDWTPNNFSVTAGAGNDSLVDTPTPYGTDTGAGGEVRGNYCTLNPLNGTGTISNGNLEHRATTTTWVNVSGTTLVSSGKWYWEVTAVGGNYKMIGIATASADKSTDYASPTQTWTYREDAYKFGDGATSVPYGATFADGDVIGVALNLDAGTITFYKNGVSQGTAFSTLSGKTVGPWVGAYNASVGTICNFGQRPFAYTAPSGFKALVTTNLPEPTVVQGDDYFNTVLWDGNSSTQSISTVGFQPDLIWYKSRSAAYFHRWFDVLRGTTNSLASNSTNAEEVKSGVTSFDSTGFTLGSDVGGNETGNTYVAWNWKANGAGVSNTDGTITSTVSANTTAGISIVTFTGTNANATIGHGLGVAPAMIIMKVRNAADDSWHVYHKSLTSAAYRLQLNSTAAEDSQPTVWNSTAPTSTVFSVGTNVRLLNHVAYCFAEVEGFSKFGSYTGNGSTDGPFLYTGFRPAFVLAKRSSTSGNSWYLIDTTRDPFNVTSHELYAEGSGAEYAAGSNLDIVSNGFKVRASHVGLNGSGSTYIYACFAEHPFRNALAR